MRRTSLTIEKKGGRAMMFHHFHAHSSIAVFMLILGVAILVACLRGDRRREP